MLDISARLFRKFKNNLFTMTGAMRLNLLFYSMNRVIVGQAPLADACAVQLTCVTLRRLPKASLQSDRSTGSVISGPVMELETFASGCRGSS
jgi:hypothetical protein